MKVFLFLITVFYAAFSSAASVGVVVTLVGEAEWQRQGTVTAMSRGDHIEAGDRLTTGAEARVVLRMNEGSVVTLGGDTQVVFSEWQYQEDSDSNSGKMEFVEGAFRFVTGLITKQVKPDLQVQTPAGTIGIRGTDFWGGYLEADVLDVVLLDGEHALAISNSAGEVVIPEPGLGVSVVAGESPQAPKVWSDEKLARAVKTIALPE